MRHSLCSEYEIYYYIRTCSTNMCVITFSSVSTILHTVDGARRQPI